MKNNALRIVAFVFNVISCIASFFYGICCIFTAIMIKASQDIIQGDITNMPEELPDEMFDFVVNFGAAFVLVIGIICLISLAWMIPMTVRVAKMKNLGIGFKVCNLLFVNIIAGVLLLIDQVNPEDTIETTISTIDE